MGVRLRVDPISPRLKHVCARRDVRPDVQRIGRCLPCRSYRRSGLGTRRFAPSTLRVLSDEDRQTRGLTMPFGWLGRFRTARGFRCLRMRTLRVRWGSAPKARNVPVQSRHPNAEGRRVYCALLGKHTVPARRLGSLRLCLPLPGTPAARSSYRQWLQCLRSRRR